MAIDDLKVKVYAGLSPAKRALLLRKLVQQHNADSVNQVDLQRSLRSTAPLSYGQQMLWFLHQLNPDDIAYNRPSAMRISGTLDQKLLQRSLEAIILRHEILRTTFSSSDGIPFQRIHSSADIPISFLNMTEEPEHLRDKKAEDLLLSESKRTFDLSSGPLLRFLLLQISKNRQIMILCTHHIIFDGWSERIFWAELASHYDALLTGRKPAVPELAIQFSDYVQWQQQRLEGPWKTTLLQYWQRQFENLRMLDLPSDRPRPAVLSYAGACVNVTLPRKLVVRLKQISHRCEATLFMTLLAGFQVLLSRYSLQNDIAVGTPVAGRQRLELEPLIGVFINVLVLRTHIGAQRSFRELLAQVRANTLDAFSHQEMPFELLIEELRPKRDSSRSPFIQGLFQVRNMPAGPVNIAGQQMERMPLDLHTSKMDLSLDVTEVPDGLLCELEYSTDLFNADTIRILAKDYERLLRDLVARPDLPLEQLDSWRQIPSSKGSVRDPSFSQLPATRVKTACKWAEGEPQTGAAYANFPSVFEAQVLASPDHLAVVGDDGALTYSQLNDQANALARRLLALGVKPGVPVALCLARSVDMIIAIMGIIKSGGAYVPLDPAYPKARLQWMLVDSGAAAVVTREELLGMLPEIPDRIVLLNRESKHIKDENFSNLPAAAPNDPVYIIYTSGSTGMPKGVAIPHVALMHYVKAAQKLYGMTAADHVLQFASICFDGAVEEIFCALAAGATLYLRSESMPGSMRGLLDECAKSGITFMSLTTAYWHQLSAAIAAEGLQLPLSLRMVVVGGEKMNGALVRTWFEHVRRPVRLLNTYGPTETAVVATAYEISHHNAVDPVPEIPIGRPIGNTRVFILDEMGKPVPKGAAGELYIGGGGVAIGYLNRGRLTEERFIADRFSTEPGARMFRTGDLVRCRSDGEIEFLGRLDDQIKVRGFRIEPGEVEAALLCQSKVRMAAVTARNDQLIAYLVADDSEAIKVGELRRKIGEILPDYMVPSVYIQLETLPLTVGGKLDRKALPETAGKRLEITDKTQGPRTKLEEELAEIWCKVLKLERVGVHDNFFELGGHSLLATQVMSRVRSVFGVVVPLRVFFENPTIEGLSEAVEGALSAGIVPLPMPMPKKRPG